MSLSPDATENLSSIKTQQEELEEWIRFGLRLGMQSAFHPFEYARVLIQIGYEPVPPRPARTLFGYETLLLPNIFNYVKYIRSVDGYSGLFVGLMPRLMGTIVSSVGSERIARHFGLGEVKENFEDNEEMSRYNNDQNSEEDGLLVDKERKAFQRKLKRDIVIQTTTILIAQPFQVISIRMMAQFIGRETLYSGVWSAAKEIYKDHGIMGFFSGLVPRLIGDISCLVVASTTAYFVNKHFISDKEPRNIFHIFTNYIFSAIFYPFQVVSVCMSVSGSSLAAGRPPYMPVYSNWHECWNHLNCIGELKRGNSMFLRYYRTPEVINRNFPMTFAPLPTVTKYK